MIFSWRARRQIAAIIVVLIVAGTILAFNITKFIPPPSCTDNKKNQGEIETDCGGPCAPCELRNPLPVSVYWARAVPVRHDTYDVAAFVQNPNEFLSSSEMRYEFVFYDSFGEVARREGSTFILPQEKTHIIEAGIQTTRQPERVGFRIKKMDWSLQKAEKPSLIVDKREYKILEESGKKQSVIDGSVLNRSPFTLKEVEILFVLLDKDGNLLGINKTLVDNLRAGESRDIRTTWPSVVSGDVTSLEIDERVNVFEPDYIINPR